MRAHVVSVSSNLCLRTVKTDPEMSGENRIRLQTPLLYPICLCCFSICYFLFTNICFPAEFIQPVWRYKGIL